MPWEKPLYYLFQNKCLAVICWWQIFDVKEQHKALNWHEWYLIPAARNVPVGIGSTKLNILIAILKVNIGQFWLIPIGVSVIVSHLNLFKCSELVHKSQNLNTN